jgi:hypothetical protein
VSGIDANLTTLATRRKEKMGALMIPAPGETSLLGGDGLDVLEGGAGGGDGKGGFFFAVGGA